LSSILKALKRIEGQSPPPETFPALPESVDAKQAVNTNARKRWRLRRVITVSLVLLIIVITAAIVFQKRKLLTAKIFPPPPPATHQQKSRAVGEKSKIFGAKIPPATVRQAPQNSAPPGAVRPQDKTVAPGQKTKKIRTINRSTPSRAKDEGQSTRSVPAVDSQQPQNGAIPDKPAPEKYTPSKKSIAGKQTASSKPAATAVNKTKAMTYAKLADSNIKLQALAWSADAARRMAVINGRIVREGESMEGYQINQIREEDVVVSDGKQSWRLEFGLKQ
jgi:hypothetical protein